MLPTITAEATVVADPELKFSASGKAWSRLRLVCNDRVKDAQGQWTDGEPFWFSAVLFGTQAENMAESVLKGDRVNITGRVKTNEWTTQEGETRRDVEVMVDTIGASLLFGAAKTDRMRGSTRPDRRREEWVSGAGPSGARGSPRNGNRRVVCRSRS